MTEQEFIQSNPEDLSGTGYTNLLMSSSVVQPGVDNTPLPPYHLRGMTIPYTTANGVNIQTVLDQADEFRFQYTEGTVRAKITARQRRKGYYFFRFEEVVLNTIPTSFRTIGGQQIPIFTNSNYIFIPYSTVPFFNNDYNPVIGNAIGAKLNAVALVVDRNSSQANPTNLEAIIGGGAQRAAIQNCSYTKIGIINSRYQGTKLNSGSIPGDDPALSLKEFEGSIHAFDASTITIKGINTSDRDLKPVYFTPYLSGSHPNKKLSEFPDVNTYMYIEEKNRFRRIVNSKIFSTDKGLVYTSDELGKVTLVS